MDPLNVSDVETSGLVSTASGDAAWDGGFFAYGGNGAQESTVISFSIPPGKRLGRHTDTGEEDLEVIGFFAGPKVQQHWSDEVWEPGDLRVTGSPNS